MRYLYFDLISGISGDMIVASLLDLTKDIVYLKNGLRKINLKEYEIKSFRRQSGHIMASCFSVRDVAKRKRVFQFREIRNIINKSRLNNKVKKDILDIYNALYDAEKKVHGLAHTHFQQVGEIDSIIDIASSCILIDKLKIGRILYSSVPFGEKVAPATAGLLKSKDIYLSKRPYENITPTGIAIITTLGLQISNIQNQFVIKDIGYGRGSIQIGNSINVLRAVLLEDKKSDFKRDEILVIQCNLDDMNPQVLGFLTEKLYEAGALEVYSQNYYTKKSRLGILISVLSKQESLDTITDIIFKETTSLGIRYFKADRLKLERKERLINTSLGKIRIKETVNNKYKKVIPEYDDCVKIAKSKNIALKDILINLSGAR